MAKARVYELAKELGVDSKTVLEKLKDMGEFVKSASSTVEAPVVRRLKAAFPKDGGNDSRPSAKKSSTPKSGAPAAAKPAATPAAVAGATPATAAPSAPKPGQRSNTSAKPGAHNTRRNEQTPRPGQNGGQRGATARPHAPGKPGANAGGTRNGGKAAPTPHAPQHGGNRGGSNNAPKPGANAAQHAPRPGNNPFSRKQGMHTPTPGDIPRPHPMARPTVNNNERRGGGNGRPGQRGGFRPRPGQGGSGAPKPGSWGQHRQGAGSGGGRPGGNRFGGGNGGNNFQNNGPSNGPSRGGGRGRGGAAGAFGRQGGKSSKARKNRLAKRHEYEELKAPVIGGVRIPTGNGQTIRLRQGASLADLAEKINVNPAALVTVLFHLGEMATATQSLDESTFQILGEEIGWNIKIVSAEEEDKELLQQFDIDLESEELQEEADLKPRPPVVTVMGHVDHGKTRLLDTIRRTNVVAREAGGITQRIGAYQVTVDLEGEERKITFLDTPGHEAFTAMRMRGAQCTDIVVLVVAADDGIMPQTVEAINHSKAAGVPIIVAINKMDKPEANPERIKQQLTEYGLVCEEWGGDTIVCPISAKTGMGVDNLLEMLTLTAEVGELKANPNRAAQGTVIEARLDKGRGPVATLLVQNGTLKQGDIIIAGTAVGRVRAMVGDKGQKLTSAGPSVPVEITGLSETPSAGATFNAVADEKLARELVEQRKEEARAKANAPVTKVSLEDLFSQIQAGEMKNLNIIVKADVQGSVEAVKASLEKLSNDEVRVRVIHGGVGAINESDVMLASTSQAIIVGFNVRPDNAARDSAARAHVDMRMYRVIYDAINEIESAMKGMLAPKFREALLGHAEVRQTYKVSGVGTVAGCYVQDGKLQRKDCQVRLVRDGIVIHEGVLASLQRFKDSVKEVAAGYECGLSIEKFNDIKEGDIIEAFTMEEIPQ